VVPSLGIQNEVEAGVEGIRNERAGVPEKPLEMVLWRKKLPTVLFRKSNGHHKVCDRQNVKRVGPSSTNVKNRRGSGRAIFLHRQGACKKL